MPRHDAEGHARALHPEQSERARVHEMGMHNVEALYPEESKKGRHRARQLQERAGAKRVTSNAHGGELGTQLVRRHQRCDRDLPRLPTGVPREFDDEALRPPRDDPWW